MENLGAMQNNGLKLWCLLLVICLGNCLPDGDLCKWMNGRKYYIDVGESGIISVENATSLTKALDPVNNQPQIPQRCSVELITCPSCHLLITIQKLAIPNCSNDKTCRCDFLWIKESAYSKSGREYCGFKENGSLDLVYESKTKLVSVDFLYSGNYKEAFSLHFSAKKNVYIYKGGYEYYQSNSSGVIKSPNFPGGYPSDYSAEFILQNLDLSGFVQLIFTDFQLSLWSYIEIFDSNGTRIDVYNGNTFRPPAIISSGPTLTVKFQANDEYPSTGFQAKYTFVGYLEKYWINRPSTDCGGFVEDFGGAITMMNMVPSNTLRAFDCIWLIRPRNSHVPETQVAIRVAQFEEMGPKSTLTIRQGQHSDAPLLESVTTFQHHKMPRGQEFVVPATSGFYIRLIGYFTNKSHMAIIYTTFRYEGCYGASDFECENGRCVKSALRCDGFNHCGDGSDEASCYGVNPGTAIPEDANWWRTLTPNYYFPKPDSGSGAGTNTLILVTSLAGLGMFVLTTIMILVKLHRQRHEDSISREILHTVSGDLDMENSPNHHGGSDLPLYDPPPSYEDVIKLYLPPPPPYSTINRGQPRTSRSRAGGVDNRGYRNDSPGGARVHTRRPRASHQPRIAPQDNLHPLILKVSLPEENLVIPIMPTSRNNTICDTTGPNSNALTLSSVLEQDPNSESTSVKNESGPEVVESSTDVQGTAPKQSNSSLSSSSGHAAVENDNAEFCECEGACSCKLISKKKQIAIARCSSESKAGSSGSNSSHFLKSERAAVSKKRSFKDMMQKGISRASPSAIIPHPAGMTITIHPPRSKKLGKDEAHIKSRSVGPSSPADVDSPPPEYDSDCPDNGQKFTFALGHRRSSSGPSDVSSSLNCISNIPAEEDVVSSQKSASESQIQTDAPPMSQAKYLASVLLDGLQQSFSFRSDDSASANNQATSKEDDKSIVPVNWTNLLIPARKRQLDQNDLSQNVTVDKSSWTASDTHPLLLNGSQKTSIVNFDEQNSPAKSLPSQTQNISDGESKFND
ncbi:uncharacterized protein NPIL_241821 [Nephila pilipes]|uniref:Neuropilin and tolloid-like protein 2 n=1 Tax=Nephila pilipes TaxID=299642 RepID=A0A8X6TP32_NEPPI|nr:uncharacterized protein NPIL_241821 [Nephila pilipes]